MNRKIHIENLRIRMKNVSPEQARGIGNNLGNEILHRLAEDSGQTAKVRRIESLDGGTVNSENKTTDLQSVIARRIASLIGGKNR